ncbi:Sucrose-phosphate synthase [Cynara cardunculus var. scolymus]|uniref:Sucrose-phosphate synthase n=1 Tax=Cynara cardunculus var. scolymus TaxID=59895 RepID=A0A103Y0K9_CYNCS|nr:Sucrose-phosphate synthase [Cynara cardunculus var. scolymus]
MAGNEWINGYLEAILDSKASNIDDHHVNLREGDHFNPTKYFVEEVVTGVDETDLHRTWIKVVATRNTRERTSRLENMCWRIWHLTRKKKQLDWEDIQRMTKRRLEREQGRRDVGEDISEDLSEEEKGDILGDSLAPESPRKTPQQNVSNFEIWSDDKKEKKLYIILIRHEFSSLKRHIRFEFIKYVVELAAALAKMPGVYRVDLFTRQVSSPEVDWSYGEPTEMLTAGSDDPDAADVGESSGAYIIRIPFGPRDKYLRKELLWPHIQEFVDGALVHVLNMSKVLGEQIGGGQPIWPFVIHGHYADAGDSAALLSGALNVPMVLTGHSLGRNKLEQLLKQGRQSKEDINSTYKIMRRIEAEELSLDAAELVITSTKQEIDEQWGLYDGFDVKLEKVLRARARQGVDCHGRFMPRMAADGDLSSLTNSDGASPKAMPAIWSEIALLDLVLNKIASAGDAFFDKSTQANDFGLVETRSEEKHYYALKSFRVFTTVLKLVDRYDLYGQVAFPKHHTQNDVPEIYRLAAKTKALNNGLLIDPHDQQAIASALLKLVSEKNLWSECQKNGWKNIHLFSWPEHCRTYLTRVVACRMRHPMWKTDMHADEMPTEGSLNDSLRDFQDASLRLSIDGDKSSSINGSLDGGTDVQDQVRRVMSKIKKPEPVEKADNSSNNGPSKYPMLRKRQKLIVIALDCYDNNGAPDKGMIGMLQETFKAVKLDSQMARTTGFAMSTAMSLSELLDFLRNEQIKVNEFDALVCSSGSEVYYPGTYEEGGKLTSDPDYTAHIEYRWGSDGLKKTIWKLMNMDGGEGTSGKQLKKLRMRGLRCHPMYCRNSTRLQLVPLFASRSQALRYFFVRWRLNVANIYVILGETGDTDYEELISGTHKTLIMKGSVKKGSEELLRTSGSYLKDDIVPGESPLIAYVNTPPKAQEIANALNKVSVAAS